MIPCGALSLERKKIKQFRLDDFLSKQSLSKLAVL